MKISVRSCLVAFFGIVCAIVCAVGGCQRPVNRVVLYCALDVEFAEKIVRRLQGEHGLNVLPKYDTEANKSVGLAEDILREKDRPRADIYWNNEILQTLRLKHAGALAPLDLPREVVERFPPECRDKAGYWLAFAARARVLIVNREKVNPGDYPVSIEDLSLPKYRGRVAMAKPFFGTTSTHFAALRSLWGAGKFTGWVDALNRNQVAWLSGNKNVAQRVATGEYHLGLTDTDDAILEMLAGHPVEIVYLDDAKESQTPLGTLFIPNTIARVQGGPATAQTVQSFLLQVLSTQTEIELAEAGGYQIPLGKEAAQKARLHPAIRTPYQVRPMRVDWEDVRLQWADCQSELRERIAR